MKVGGTLSAMFEIVITLCIRRKWMASFTYYRRKIPSSEILPETEYSDRALASVPVLIV